MKKQVSFSLIAVMMAALLFGCGAAKAGSKNETLGVGESLRGGETLGVVDSVSSGRTGAQSTKSNTQEASLTAEMLYGIYENQYFYRTDTADGKIDQAIENLKFEERVTYPGESISETVPLTAVPINITASRLIGNYNLMKEYDLGADTEWQRMYADIGKELPGKQDEYISRIRSMYNTNFISMVFAGEDGTPYNYRFAYTYTVDGNTIHCKKIQSFNDDFTITYCEPEVIEDYQVSFRGDSMIIEKDGCVGTLLSLQKHSLVGVADEEYDLHVNGGIDKPENAWQNIRSISVWWNGSRTEARQTVLYFVDGSRTSNASATHEEPNKVTVSWDKIYDAESKEQDGSGTVTFKYLTVDNPLMGVEGFILIDDTGKTYPYIYDDKTFMLNTASDNVEDTEEVKELDENAQARVIEEKNNVISTIKDSFEKAGVKAEIDEQSGTVRFDSGIVFGSDSAEIADAGKTALDEFLKVYIPIMQELVQNGNISKVLIDGHTDTNRDHEYNQELSEKRAQAVAEYVIASYPEIESYIETKGYSYDKPIFAEDGSVDMAASRRVEFRFILNTD